MNAFHRVTWAVPASLAALTLGLLGLGCSDTTLIVDPGTPPPTRVNATIEVTSDHPTDPHTVDFGEVYAGESREKEVTIRNIGTDTLTIEDLDLAEFTSTFEITNADEWSHLLAPDASTVVRIKYSPVQDEHIEGSMVVVSNDRENPAVPVRLLAEGLAPAVDIQPPSFDFGNLELGCVGQEDFVIANIGRAPLVISEISYEDLGAGGELVLTHGLTLPATLNPDAYATVQVHYAPSDVEPDSGVLHVLSNDPSTPDAIANQFGIAHLGESKLDEFLQQGDNSTDILWIIDNSCSMMEEQSSLAVNFASFMGIIEAIDVDFHIGASTTDIADNGVLVGTVPIITPSTPDPGGTFSANVNLGINGSGTEQGLEGAYLALSSPNIDPGGANDGFLREEAGLRIIFLSDEAEQSNTVRGWNPADYVAYFQSLKANPDHVITSDITGQMAGCNGSGGNASAGVGYVEATTMTGGLSISICDPNWSASLAALGWLSQSFADTFELSETPVIESIEVRLNNVPVYVGWVYDESLNAVVFDLDHIPENGDEIAIEYTVLGDCTD